MINKFVAMGLGALVALAPMAAVAQEQVAQAAPAATEATPAPSRHQGIAQTPYPAPGARGGPQGKGLSPPSAQPGPRRYRGSEELILVKAAPEVGANVMAWGADCRGPLQTPNRAPSALVVDDRLGRLSA